jgi:hypothetical protein
MGHMDDYASHDALALAERVRKGEVKPRELLEVAIGLAERHASLGAVVIPMFDEARRVVEADLPDGPFRGVPFLLKDLHAAFAGVRLTNGSRLFRDCVPDYDSELVARYKRAPRRSSASRPRPSRSSSARPAIRGTRPAVRGAPRVAPPRPWRPGSCPPHTRATEGARFASRPPAAGSSA